MSVENAPSEPLLRLGTSSWSTKDWIGKVYAPGTKPTDFITQYAQRFLTVEIDSTFYAIPRKSVVEGWRARTPDHFIFSAKAPQVITHEKFLENCAGDRDAFLETMALLGNRLGPILFQFPYYAKRTGITSARFLDRLGPFLADLPKDGLSFAVEIRNKTWIGKPLLDLLRKHHVALALIDHPWMARPHELTARGVLVTGPFAYIRWLGDRKGIEKITTTWNESVIDRRPDLERWVPLIKGILDRQVPIFGYVNNHYSGHAPADIDTLMALLAARE